MVTEVVAEQILSITGASKRVCMPPRHTANLSVKILLWQQKCNQKNHIAKLNIVSKAV